MKYKVKDLLDHHNLISHLFLECLGRDSNELIHSITDVEGYNVDTTEVEICLTFNGVEKDMERFIKRLDKGLDELVEKKVSERIDEILPDINWDVFYEMRDKVEEIVNEYRREIISGLTVKNC